MRLTRLLTITTLLLGGALLFWPGIVLGDSEVKLSGFVDVPPAGPGGSLTLPLPEGASPVTVFLSIGIPTVVIPVIITPQTEIEAEEGSSVTIVDGDRLEIEAMVVSTSIFALEVEVEPFPELELICVTEGLPPGGVPLPLAPGTTLNFTCDFAGFDLPVRLTSAAKVEDAPFTLTNTLPIRIEGAVRDGAIVITELELVD